MYFFRKQPDLGTESQPAALFPKTVHTIRRAAIPTNI